MEVPQYHILEDTSGATYLIFLAKLRPEYFLTWHFIKEDVSYNIKETVALRKESVDRNQVCIVTGRLLQVALRKESVDRNFDAM